MPRLAKEVSETALTRLLKKEWTKRTVMALGNPRGLCVRLNPGKQSSAPCYLTYRMKEGDQKGKVQWLPLGNFPDMSLEELRDAASPGAT